MQHTSISREAAILAVLPSESAEKIRAASSLYGGSFQELRLYRNGHAVIVCSGRNIRTSAVCGDRDFDGIVLSLCGNSFYAHCDTLREGFIFTEDGLRIGVCGRAVCHEGRIERITDISSLCIRVPARFPEAVDDLLPFAAQSGSAKSMLIWSRPGVGKTTVLRELAVRLSSGSPPFRCALIDTRYELGADLTGDFLDIFSGYPRAAGMELAIRTMAPQIVICDEIAGKADADAVMNCAASGAAVIASAHAGSVKELLTRAELRQLIEMGMFSVLVGLLRTDSGIVHEITPWREAL